MGFQFLLHIMLLICSFETEVDLTAHASIHEVLRHSKIISEYDNPEGLQEYSNKLLLRYAKEKNIYFPNS